MWNTGGKYSSSDSKDCMVISASNTGMLQKMWDKGEFEKIFNSPTHWTRITVVNGAKHEKDMILRLILVATFPEQVFPALYQIDGEDSFFLVRNCSMFIRKLAQTRLTVTNSIKKLTFSLKITTNYLSFSVEPLNVTKEIVSAIANRYNAPTKTLDLSNFTQDDRLKDIYFNLNVPQCIRFIFGKILDRSFCNIWKITVSILILQHNDLRSLELNDNKMISIEELDLRNNNITWDGFEKMKSQGWRLNRIWLGGNPLCISLTEAEFIKRVTAVMPTVNKIDGVYISNSNGLAVVNSFLFDGSWGPFIDHFLHHYFGLLESPNRHLLLRMYHLKAKFTLCAHHDPNDTPNRSKLSTYLNYSRNLQTLSDVTKSYTTMKTGPKEIMEVLNSLPIMQFDPNTFTVDVPLVQKDTLVLIDVGGVFKELDSELFYFHRSFVLTPYKKNLGEWKIETDMLSVSPATPEQISKSFKRSRRPPSPEMLLKLNPNVKDRDSLIPVFSELTQLKPAEAIRFLEDGLWDLETTLQSFTDQLKANQIPVQSFNI